MTPTVNVLPDLYNFSLQIIATIVLFVVLRHFLFKPVSDMLNARKEGIENNINEAKAQREEAINLKNEYELKIQEAKDEARSIVEASKKRGDQLREEIVSEAKKEAEGVLVKAKNEIERERERTMEDLKSEVVTIAMLAATKVVEKNLDANTHKDMINKFIDEVGEAKWQN